jgi:TonB family protein
VRVARLKQTLQCAAASVLLLSALAPHPAAAVSQAGTQQDPLEPAASAQQLDTRIDNLRKGTWNLYSQEFTEDADIGGRTLKQDVDQWMLPPANLARLEALLTKARAQESAHQEAALRKTLEEANVLVQQEVYRGELIANYWLEQTHLMEHQKVFDALQARLPAQARTAEPAQIKAARTAAATQFSAALAATNPSVAEQKANTDKMHAALTAVYVAYYEQIARLGTAVGEAERAAGVAPLSLVRTEPCPPAPASTSGNAEPAPTNTSGSVKPARFTPNNHADPLYYPPELRRLELEGAVIVATTVSPSGCATRSEVYSPSGAQAFDESALKWALQASYLPAEHDGKAVESVMRMRVRFQLRQ